MPFVFIGALSAAALSFLVWLIYFNQQAFFDPQTVAWLPALNAILNSLSALCLVAGIRAVRAGRTVQHARWIRGALGFSALFLVSYLIYHSAHGDTKFMGQGPVRPLYFFVLISHIVLSGLALPMILTTVWLSISGRLATHKKLARFTFPVWLYVSVTGVLIFGLLKIFG